MTHCLAAIAADPTAFAAAACRASNDDTFQVYLSAALAWGPEAAGKLVDACLPQRLVADWSDAELFADPAFEPFLARFRPVKGYPSPALVRRWLERHADSDPNSWFGDRVLLVVRGGMAEAVGVENLFAASRHPHVREGASEAEVVWLYGEPDERVSRSGGVSEWRYRVASKNAPKKSVIGLSLKMVDGRVQAWSERQDGGARPARARLKNQRLQPADGLDVARKLQTILALVDVALFASGRAREERRLVLTDVLGLARVSAAPERLDCVADRPDPSTRELRSFGRLPDVWGPVDWASEPVVQMDKTVWAGAIQDVVAVANAAGIRGR